MNFSDSVFLTRLFKPDMSLDKHQGKRRSAWANYSCLIFPMSCHAIHNQIVKASLGDAGKYYETMPLPQSWEEKLSFGQTLEAMGLQRGAV